MQAHNFDYYIYCVSEHTVKCTVCCVIQLSSVGNILLTLSKCTLLHTVILHRLKCSGLRRILPRPLRISTLDCAWHYFNRQIQFIFKQTVIPSNLQPTPYQCLTSSCCISLLSVFCNFPVNMCCTDTEPVSQNTVTFKYGTTHKTQRCPERGSAEQQVARHEGGNST